MSTAVLTQPLQDPLLAAIAEARPAYARLFAEGGHKLGSFIRGFSEAELPAIQSRSDYIAQVERQVRIHQGGPLAARVRARLERSPLVFTANHLCMECLPLTVQSMVVAALGEDPAGALPVEASGLVPADNPSYPVGLLLARRIAGKPVQVPVLDLSNRLRRQMTMLLDPFTAGDLQKAEARAQALAGTGQIGARELAALSWILGTALRAPEVLDRPDFSCQAMAATSRFWDAWFTPEARRTLPPLAYYQAESIRTPLLLADLREPGSPVHRLFFDPALREAVLLGLDGLPCCWKEAGKQGGSALLWAIAPNRRTAPLVMEGNALVNGEGKRLPLEPAALVDGLEAGTLVPTSFLSMALGLVRGLVQVGGFNQVDYLAAIQERLAQAMAATGYAEWAGRLRAALPPMLTAAFAPVAVAYPDGLVASAGGVELMAHGGLGAADLERIRDLTLEEALALELPGIARMVLGDRVGKDLPGPGVLDGSLMERLLILQA